MSYLIERFGSLSHLKQDKNCARDVKCCQQNANGSQWKFPIKTNEIDIYIYIYTIIPKVIQSLTYEITNHYNYNDSHYIKRLTKVLQFY